MGKELIISSTRHETKVAVMEDDQLVEIYFQRANEYSLAGSIHKGRVTRVLPGMQSAFVDIGLDRDAFLYVTDFFDENEEYDRFVTRSNGKPTEDTNKPTTTLVAPEGTDKDESSAGEAASGSADSSEDGAARDRKGRRSRRRRSRGRGFPDSKYASDDATTKEEDSAKEVKPAGEDTASDDRSLPVLPGESLAKYMRTDKGASAETEPDQAAKPASSADGLERSTSTLDEADSAPDTEAEETLVATAVAVTVASELAGEETDAETDSDAVALEDEESEETPEEEAATTEAEEEPPVEEVSEDEAEESKGDADADEPVSPVVGSDSSAEETQPEAAVEDDGGQFDEKAEAVVDQESTEAEAAEETPGEGEEVEPARIPTSLTATLREKGSRFLHRVPRRARRKARAAVRTEETDDAPMESRPGSKGRGRRRSASADEGAESGSVPNGSAKATAPSIAELLREGQEILVQVAKEPLGQKGARITSHIALPGRYVVYMPTLEHLGVSRKISSDDERARLRKILQTSCGGMPGGWIVRTAGEGKSEKEIADDVVFLFNLWQDIRQKADKRPAPALIHHDLDLVQRILRDQLTKSFKTVWIDSEEIYESTLRFVQRFQPAMVGRVKMYTRSTPIFDAFGTTEELEKALRPKVWLKSGGYIVVNQTEALVAIDVNTGKYVGKSNRLEDTIVKTNSEAVKEIVRQIRLRDLGGIIVVDFIDMDERKNRQKVMQVLEEEMRSDRAPNKILQFNDFGLVAITRKRVKQSLERTLCSPCPYCEGAGYVKSVQTVIGEILQEARKLVDVIDTPDALLRTHPSVAKELKSNSNSYLEEIEEILGRPVLVKGDATLHPQKFDLA